MKSIKISSTLFLQIPRLLINAALTGPRGLFGSVFGNHKCEVYSLKGLLHELAATQDQSSLRINESCRGEGAGIDRERFLSKNHGISRIVKGVDLDVAPDLCWTGLILKKTFTNKELEWVGFHWEKLSLLPKKSYIQTKISHFYNI